MKKYNRPNVKNTRNLPFTNSTEELGVLYDIALQQAKSRSLILLSILIIGVFILIARGSYLQLIDHKKYIAEGEKRYQREEVLRGKRGLIVDRNNDILAVSEIFAKIIASPQLYNSIVSKYPPDKIRDVGKRVEKLAKYLKKPVAEINKTLSSGSGFAVLASDKQPQIAENEILGIPGLEVRTYNKRLYPTAEVNSRLLGLTDNEDKGQEGFEKFYELRLQDKPGIVRKIKDLRRNVVEAEIIRDSHNGEKLILSIDNRIQQYAYSVLADYVTASKANAGALVAIDTITGELLAMTSYPGYDPNDRADLKIANMGNIPVNDIFEPGSTIKPFFAALLLDKKITNTNVVYNTGAELIISGKAIVDSSWHDKLNLSGIIQQSSNRGIVRATENLSKEDSYEMLAKLGFGEVLPISLPGSVTGVLRNYKQWYPLDKATIAFGHTMSASLLQLARAYTVFTRGGEVIQPTLFKTENIRAKGRRVFSPQATAQVVNMLEAVVNGGTGKLANIPGYSVAGKTGTAKKFIGGAYQKKYIATFVGFAPVRNPQILIAVMVNEPESDSKFYSGGGVAAPIFAKVMEQALRLKGVKADRVDNNEVATLITNKNKN